MVAPKFDAIPLGHPCHYLHMQIYAAHDANRIGPDALHLPEPAQGYTPRVSDL